MFQTLKLLSRRTFLAKAVLIGSLSALSLSAFALPSDRNQPISLLADRATYNEKTGVTTYTGNVVIEQGTMKLQASSLVANLNKDRGISTITASGSPAKFQQQVDANKPLSRGQAQKILYNAETGILTLSGGASLSQNGASISGSTLRYSMNKGDIEALGSGGKTDAGRVKIVIPPSNSKSFPGVRD